MIKKVKINNINFSINKELTIIQGCSEVGIEIPRFCYHDKLSIAGNCRMCLVEVKKSLKPVASCAMPLSDGMEIFTQSSLVKKAREGVLEFLLVNHPLDCPICDQGGECDLQDQAMIFGSDRGRFYDYKRSVEDKDCGPFIKTLMTRCIHCTRCIRFIRELGGIYDFGTTGRGFKMEIGTYISKNLSSEISGNIIDLCPVGALTSKPYAFVARSWELQSVNSIDVSDSFGSNIRIDFRGSEIMRVLPRLNENLNEEWLSDKGRFNYDGLKYQRLYYPMVKYKNGNFVQVSWSDAFDFFRYNLVKKDFLNNKLTFFNSFNFKIGNQTDCESVLLINEFQQKLGYVSNYQFENYNFKLNCDFRNNYLMSLDFKKILPNEVFLFLGSNLRLESPLLNLHFRKNSNKVNFIVGSIGYNLNLGYKCYQLGNSLKKLIRLLEGNHWFCNFLVKSNFVSFIIGAGFFGRMDGFELINSLILVKDFLFFNKKKKNLLNFLFLSANQIGFYEFGLRNTKFIQSKLFNFNFYYLLNYNKPFTFDKLNSFIIYHGFHGDWGANHANLIFPSSSFVEKDGLFVNNFGLTQEIKSVFYPVGEALSDWQILIGLSDSLLIFLDYSNLKMIRFKLSKFSFLFNLKLQNISNYKLINFCNFKLNKNENFFLINSNFNSFLNSNYMVEYDLTSKYSKNMLLAHKNLQKRFINFNII